MNQILAPLRYGFNILELSWLRLIVLFFSWIGVGYVLYINGGIHSILAEATQSLFVVVLSILAVVIQAVFAIVALWGFLKSPNNNVNMLTDPSFSNNPSNIYYRDDH